MGQTCAAVVSDLVSKGYAHLTSFQQAPRDNNKVPTRATFAFLPDPVCARISMVLMDADSRFERSGGTATKSLQIRGNAPKWWAEQMGDLFSSGLCQANQGDFGETASALYLLFCGDRLRKQADNEYKTFSVDLNKWLKIVAQCAPPGTSGLPADTSANESIEATVNFIQFFRYPARLSLDTFGSSEFLNCLYCKGCAIYAPNNMKAVDLIIPCKVSEDTYVPIFVSVKNYTTMSPGEANDFLSQSLLSLHSDGVTNGLLLLCVVGQDGVDIKSGYKNVLGTDIEEDLKVLDDSLQGRVSATIGDIGEKLVPKMFCIQNDEFGIHSAIISSKAQTMKQQADVFAIHHELLHQQSTGWLETGNEEEIQKLLPSNYREDARDLLQQALWCVKKEGQLEE